MYHGVATPIHIKPTKHPLFKDLPYTISAGRYHSWVIDASTLSKMWEIAANDENNEIMANSTQNASGMRCTISSGISAYTRWEEND